MLGVEVIAVSALIASRNVVGAPLEKSIQAGSLGIQVTQLCIKDKRDLNNGVVLRKYDGVKGRLEVKCQVLEINSGLYYASKDFYYTSPMLEALVEILEEIKMH